MMNATTATQNQERFRDLMERNSCLGCDRLRIDDIYAQLAWLYKETGRFYHDCSHLAHCLAEFDRVKTILTDADTLELALWFHDAVYVPGATDNEERSASLLKNCCTGLTPGLALEKASRLILATTHKFAPQDDDEAYMLDIDLSSFGSAWPDYMRDTLNIRKERQAAPDQVYFHAHAGFLRSLLARPRIFYSDFFYRLYEASSRANICRLLATPEYSEIES